ncbi:MAG: carbohydate-binding domain-containing protein [Prevotellaceae bacterium]|jgi:hexosaminidase|nr:carbohydate-binding domain-containing protein [Prevotellaceae bacterium]
MKTTSLILTTLLSCFILSCNGNKQTSAPVSITWEMGQNGVKPGYYEHSFRIKNTGKTELKNNWVIYYNQMPMVAQNTDSAQLILEHISSTFFKIYPSQNYKPVAAGETLNFTVVSSGSIIKESNTPSGAYIVFTDENGKEQQAQNIELKIVPFTHSYQWTRPRARELPYPDGNYVYEQNAFFTQQFDLDETHIFPEIKTINKEDGKSLFSKNIQIENDAEFTNEADLLKTKLSSLFGCNVSEKGETVVKLKKLSETANKEYYEISVENNAFIISACNSHGIFNGCQTLINILGNKENLPAEISNMKISDYPDAEYRGMMLDVSRNFTSKNNVFKLIDVLSLYKINVLHLHLTDDEGWRLEIPGLEELTQIGSRRGHTRDERDCLYPAFSWGWDASDKNTLANGYYSRNDFIEILKYAKQRHIEIIPEIEFPGHARAAIKAMNARYHKYMETDKAKAEEYLLTDFADTSKYLSAQSFTDNVINVAMPSTYKFVEKVIDEVHTMFTDADVELKTVHLGGDEVPHGAWEGSAISLNFMKQQGMTEIRDLKDYFVQQVLDMLNKHDIQLAAWQDVVLLRNGQSNERFANKNVLTYCWNNVPEWKDDEIPYKLANAGYPIILANVTNLYIDMAYNKHQNEPGLHWGGFVNEFNTFDVLPYDIYKSVRRDFKGDLIDVEQATKTKLPLAKDAQNQIKGLQVQLFAETIRGFEMVEYHMFPKMFGMIDRAWNMQPQWSQAKEEQAYESAKQLYNAKISGKELPRLAKMNINFRLAQPGIKIVDGELHANTYIPKAEIRYTTDGSEPTAQSTLWTAPVACNAKQVKAKVFYLGKQSVTTLLENE